MVDTWFVSEETEGSNPDIYIESDTVSPAKGTICEIGGGDLGDRRRNARLIAAAPDMLAALKQIETISADGFCFCPCCQYDVKAGHSETCALGNAIKKATGK